MTTSTRYGIFALIIAATVAYISADFLPALSWGAVLAITLHPVHQFISARTRPWASTLGLTLCLLGLIILPITMLTIKAAQELPDARTFLTDFQENGLDIPKQITGRPGIWNKLSPELQKVGLTTPEAPEHIGMPPNITTRLAPVITQGHEKIVHATLTVSRHTTHIIELSLFTLISFIVFLSGGARLSSEIDRIATSIIGDSGPAHVHQMSRAIRGTVSGVVLVGIIQGLSISIPLALFHCPHPALFTLIIIVASLIPFCAPIGLAAAAITAFTSAGTTSALVIAISGLIIIFLADHLIKPKLVGHSTELGFLSSMVAILGGLKTLGLIGLFIGPALFSVGATLWKEFSGTNGAGQKVNPDTHA